MNEARAKLDSLEFRHTLPVVGASESLVLVEPSTACLLAARAGASAGASSFPASASSGAGGGGDPAGCASPSLPSEASASATEPVSASFSDAVPSLSADSSGSASPPASAAAAAASSPVVSSALGSESYSGTSVVSSTRVHTTSLDHEIVFSSSDISPDSTIVLNGILGIVWSLSANGRWSRAAALTCCCRSHAGRGWVRDDDRAGRADEAW